MTPDRELLQRYAGTRSEEAFAELVQRHVNLVYSAALRQVNGDTHLAQDVAQMVFTDLARKADSLARREGLTGWLYTSTHFAAAKILRSENRRRDREEKFMREPICEPAPEPDWNKLRPVLDDAMHELKETDREAILLRYFENRPFAEIGERFGLNENAARMRVERALEKLHGFLCKRGITTTGALASAISVHAVQVAPAHLAATLTATSVAAAGTGTTLTLLKIMTVTQIKLGISALVVAGAATALVAQHQSQVELREENQSLQQEIAQIRNENASLSNQMAAATDAKKLPQVQLNELLKLRGEVGELRQQKNKLQNALTQTQSTPARYAPANEQPQTQPQATALPEDYPKTPDAATKAIFEAMGRGDWGAFATNFTEPGVPQTVYDNAFSDEVKSNLAGMQVVSIGEPTNWLSTPTVNKWFVPYKIRFSDGTLKTFRLSVGQDVQSRRFFFDGGL